MYYTICISSKINYLEHYNLCSIEVYSMKTDVIKEALESVKKRRP